MKKTMTYVVAAAAVAMALVSCSKDRLIEKGTRNEQTSGVRTLTVSFAQGTKTNISNDMQTPVWAEGDQISLNGTPYVVPAEAKGKSTCKITTDIQGDIVAVYPASAWTAEEPHYKVESTQDGSFSKANICIDTVKVGDTEIEFKNKTALFHVVVPANTEKTTTLTVTSLKAIGTDGQRSGSAVAINTEGANDAAKAVITVEVPANTLEQNVYVSVFPGVKLTDLNFDITRDGETGTGEQGGFSANYLKDTKEISEPYAYAVAENTIYEVKTSFFHEYVTVNGKKWATMNIGATTTTDAGLYFMWGEVVGHKYVEGSWTNFPTGNPDTDRYTGGWNAESGFAVCNAPYGTEGTKAPEVTTPSEYHKYYNNDGKVVLESCDDAASANWGGIWRMPTKDEITALAALDSNSSGWDNTDGHKGWIVPGTDSKLFFPATGRGNDTTLKFADYGYYWSSSSYAANLSSAYLLGFSYVSVDTSNCSRANGHSVRAISD